MAGRRRAEATPSFGRLRPAMTKSEWPENRYRFFSLGGLPLGAGGRFGCNAGRFGNPG